MASQPPVYRESTEFPLATPENTSERPGSDKKCKQDFSVEKTEPVAVIEDAPPTYHADAEDHFGETAVVTTAKDLVTHVLHVQDDPSLNPWTFRMYFLGK